MKRPLLPRRAALSLLAAPALLKWSPARAEMRLRIAYDQPRGGPFELAANLFAENLARLSGGAMVLDQFPGGQLGQETKLLQFIRTGDIDFILSSTANASTLSPQSAVLSLHYLFRTEDDVRRAVTNPVFVNGVRGLFDTTVQGAKVIGVIALGLRHVYARREIHTVEDMKGAKIRVQATPTEDALFPAYGAQPVHLDLGAVYTSLQTGVIDMSENVMSVYAAFRHYEVAPIVSLTGHEANMSLLWTSQKLWNRLNAEQRGWVDGAAPEVMRAQPDQAFAQEHATTAKLAKIGIKLVEVDTRGFIVRATPVQDQLAAQLGPKAIELLSVCRGLA